MKTTFLVLIAISLLTPDPSSSAEPPDILVKQVAPGSYCRDEKGNIDNSRLAPAAPFSAKRASYGIIETKVGGKDCYLYSVEVVIADPAPRPSAGLGSSTKPTDTGTRDPGR